MAVMACTDEQVHELERELLRHAKLRQTYQRLLTISGIGKVLALTIAFESGDIHRFCDAGHFTSYVRMGDSRRESNGKTKGTGNIRCGNKHLSWAFIEAAHFAVRYDAVIQRFYDKNCAKSRLKVIALKAVAHKLARAAFHVMHDDTAFEVHRAFG
jgi:transposase